MDTAIVTEEKETTIAELVDQLKNGDMSILASDDLVDKRDDLVKFAYRHGVHLGFEKESQLAVLASLRMRMRSIATLPPDERKILLDEIYASAFQNPLMAVRVVISSCTRLKDFSLLRLIQVFLDLKIGPANHDTYMGPETPLIEYAILKQLLELDDTNPLWHFYFAAFGELVLQDFIHYAKLLEILIHVCKEFGKINALENVLNAIKLFKSVLKTALEKLEVPAEQLQSYGSFVSLILHSTFLADKNRTILNLRQACMALSQLINDKLVNPIIAGESISILGRSILELGLIYIRYPARRDYIKSLLSKDAGDKKWRTFEGIRELTSAVNSLISSSCRSEWGGVAEFLKILAEYNYINYHQQSNL